MDNSARAISSTLKFIFAIAAALLVSGQSLAIEVKTYTYSYIDQQAPPCAGACLPPVLLDVYMSDTSSWGNRRPAVILIHGGGWTSTTEDRKDLANLANYIAAQGLVAVSVDYRLAPIPNPSVHDTTPRFRWPEQNNNVQAAVWWMRRNASALKINPDKIAALGGSAGGLLAATLGNTNAFDPLSGWRSQVQAVITLWGPWNLASSYDRSITENSPIVNNPYYDPYNYRITKADPGILSTTLSFDMKGMIGNLLGPDPDQTRARAASPYSYISSSSPPTLLFQGTADRTVLPSQAVHACTRLTSVNAYCKLVLLNGEGHGYPSHLSDPSNPVSPRNFDIFARAFQDFISTWIRTPQSSN